MQLNIKWHADFFHSPEQMINPLDNVRYAARYLEQLYKETGSWETAVKFYHSRNSKFNTVYYAKYKDETAKSIADDGLFAARSGEAILQMPSQCIPRDVTFLDDFQRAP